MSQSAYCDCTACLSQVIYRALGPGDGGVRDPYSPEALVQLTLTSLRIRLIKAQACQSSSSSSSSLSYSVAPPNPLTVGSTLPSQSISESSATPSFSIYTLLARGTCLCHGHAEQCVRHNSSQETPEDGNTVSDAFLYNILYCFHCSPSRHNRLCC